MAGKLEKDVKSFDLKELILNGGMNIFCVDFITDIDSNKRSYVSQINKYTEYSYSIISQNNNSIGSCRNYSYSGNRSVSR